MRTLDRTTWALTWRLTRAGGRTGLLATGLAVAAAAVSTTLLLLCVAMNLGFQHRADRTDWRNPVESSRPVAVEAVGTTFTGGAPVTVVDVARLPGRAAPAPPGLGRFPGPGELWVSPALGALLDRLPADRHPVPGTPTGTLGREALAHPGELVAVIGHRPGDPVVTAERAPDPRRAGDIVSPTRVASFTGAPLTDGTGRMYESLARVATVLVIVPLLVLAASAARLSVSRRDQRLAALRLIGATPGRVAAMTAAEALLTGAAGALVGAVGYAVLLPPVASLPLAGGAWYPADLWIGALPLPAVMAGVVALVVVSALAGLRQVVVGPLGVARRSRSRGASVVRAVVFVAVVAGYGWISKEYGSDDSLALYAFAAVFLALAVIGPWVVRLLGRIVTALAKRPATLLAGRRLLDDPKAAWRIVSGLTLAGFVAGFFALLTLDAAPPWGGRPDQLAIAAPVHKVTQVRKQAEQRLRAAGVSAVVGVDDGFVATAAYDSRQVTATVLGGPAELDRARTALTGLTPDQYPLTTIDVNWSETQFTQDFTTLTRVVLVVTFTVAITSAGITTAAAVLDRRRTYALLHLAGTPLRVLDAARNRETLIPVTVLAGGAVAAGLLCGGSMMLAGGDSSFDARGLTVLAVCWAAGVGGILAAGGLSRPLLRSVTRQAGARGE
ncbi:FtsX-like permease family protein [Streptomyces luteogriseus]|uniref:FtsX-like permease family protein n=1 Tax=Streptomyces luteogriseus TaxID=68233 RepID=UPI002E300D19|nr:FtsX-like permease family protein [Streptomyces luteogriseus]WTJ29924.1 ABC transporter permease [Streptomyces luteogriseus]